MTCLAMVLATATLRRRRHLWPVVSTYVGRVLGAAEVAGVGSLGGEAVDELLRLGAEAAELVDGEGDEVESAVAELGVLVSCLRHLQGIRLKKKKWLLYRRRLPPAVRACAPSVAL